MAELSWSKQEKEEDAEEACTPLTAPHFSAEPPANWYKNGHLLNFEPWKFYSCFYCVFNDTDIVNPAFKHVY